MNMYPSCNLVESVIDEVALEGLDGITLQALWLRLANRWNEQLPFPKPFMEQIWLICRKVKNFLFYKLETPREPLVIFDRYEFVHPDLGIILEPPNVPPDIYPHCPIQDVKMGVRGSCSTYHTRKDIKEDVKNASLDEVTEKYGLSLVIVASQQVRTRALIDVDVSPTLELTIMHYCFLERVGRSRYHGEVTQGKLSLAALNENPKTLFYHRKFLLQHKLITKQIHHQKSAGHCNSGSLLHLTRFYVERKPKMIYLAEQVLDILRSKEQGVAEYDEIKKKLGIENSIKKLFKTSFFQKIVKTDICVLYRTLYPNAEPSEWRQKNDPTKEKKIRVVQVLYPDVEVADLWNKDEKEEEEEDVVELNVSNHKLNVPYLQQANAIVEASKSEGISQADLGRTMGLTKLQSRSVLRNLVKAHIIATYMNDIGRQRITKYVSKKFEKHSKLSKQFNKEVRKIKELTKKINEKNLDNQATLQAENEKHPTTHEDYQISKNFDYVDEVNTDASDIDEDRKDEKEKDKCADANYTTKKEMELKNLFYTVNRILHKYRLSKFRSEYKCTSKSLLKKTKISDVKTKNSNAKEEKAKLGISSVNMQQIVNDAKATSFYNSIKANLVAQKPVRTGKGVSEVFGFMEAVQNNQKKNANITYRLLKRANMIIEAVKEHQVIDDTSKLTKMICQEEGKEGYVVKIDKKSLIRLLQKLAKDNLVKNIKLTLSANGREKNLMFICDPNIDTDHTLIKSAVEQAKVKFCLLASQKGKVTKKTTEKLDKQDSIKSSDSKEQLNELHKTASKSHSANHKYDAKAGKRYGLSPKFIRMRTMHLLLFYLVYDHPGVPTSSQQKQVEILKFNGYEIDEALIKEFSTIYNNDVNWKMFIPPLPKHNGWPEGWALMCDVLLGMPLSIFTKVHNITFMIPELEHYLNHPIRRHYLVKNLPVTIRNTLLHARKYIFNIHDTITRLGYIGLVQFGPQRLKDKDQVFIYINRRTELMDTTSSAPGYHKIEDKSYPVTKYFFNRIQAVEKYWYDMWTICVNTLLGGRQAVHGKDILLEDLTKKSDMIKAVKECKIKEAEERDTGAVPGDRQGAAGIDSAFFAHLKRNWNWSINYSVHNQPSKNLGKSNIGQRDLHLSKIQAKPVKYTEYDGLKKISGPPPPPTVNATELRKKVHDYLKTGGRKNEALTSHHSSRQKSYVRRVLPRKKSVRKPRLKYDEDDYRAMQRMDKLRVDWDSHEDNILLVCKVTTTYLSPNPRKQMVSFIAVRDVLRIYSYTSYNKTSRACQRRLMYMLRQSRTMNSVMLGVEEIKQDPYVDRRYGGIMDKLKGECSSSGEYEKRVTEVFKELVGYIVKKYYDIAEIKPKKHMAMPKTVQEFNLLFEVFHPMKPHHNQGFTKDVRSINDIHSATINSIIHSSMCCGKDRRSWAYHLFMVYQHYSEALLKQAMNKIRSDQLVTVKKHHLASIKKYGNCMPMSSSQYQLSINYIYKFQTKWTYDVFKETYDVFEKLLQWYSEHRNSEQEQETIFNGIEIPVSSGIVCVMHDLLARDQIDFDIEMPDQIIMLDARYQGKDETYFRAAQKYQDILTRLYLFKFENVAAQKAAQKAAVSVFETEETSHEIQKDSLKRKKPENDDPKEQRSKIFRKNEESSGIKEGNQIDQNEDTSSNKKRSLDENDKREETNLKDHSHDQESKKKTRAKRLSRKRSANTEQDFTDNEDQFFKRARLNSEDSMDFEDLEESEESRLLEEECERLCEDFDSIEKLFPINEFKEQTEEEASSMQPNNIIDMTSVPRRVSEIIRNILPETSYFNYHTKIEDTSDIQKKYTRIAMLRMREELDDLSVTDSHHAHEYFVVNSFRMFYSLETSPSLATEASVVPLNVENFKGHSVPSQLVPLRIKTANDFLDELNRAATFPKSGISYMDYKNEMMTKKKEIAIDWKYVDAVYEFVYERKEIGCSSQELLDKFFDEQKEDLYKAVSLLVDNYVFLRSGVTKPRYIHHRYLDPWLINSYKILRLEQESLMPFKDSIYATMQQGKTPETNADMDAKNTHLYDEENANIYKKYETNNAIASTSGNQESNEKKNEKVGNDLNNKENETKEDSEINEESGPRPRRKKQRIRLYPQKDLYKSAQQLDFTTAENIKVMIKPWIRIDGVVNRKVLDRMLGAVLSYCLLHPGLTMAKMQSRFVPVLQPFHTRELVEMLVKLECLKSNLMKKTRVTLFSPPPVINLSDLTADTVGWPAEDEIVLEPTVDAILKFSIFLSTRTYSTDFMP